MYHLLMVMLPNIGEEFIIPSNKSLGSHQSRELGNTPTRTDSCRRRIQARALEKEEKSQL